VIIIGIIMIVTPGPAVIIIPVGLGILATEFIWARRLLRRFKAEGVRIGEAILKSEHRKKKDDNHHDAV
ncbi:PGPGW domain-containing protein, partial [bacterium]|nr:PGPGW domain-containing protein [bacterium]